jgi:hypothetical protein
MIKGTELTWDQINLINVLMHDLTTVDIFLDKQPPMREFWKRSMVRAAFAYFEGVIQVIREVALKRHHDGVVNLSPEDLNVLSGKQVEIDPTGNLTTRRSRTDHTANLIAYVLRLLLKLSGASEEEINKVFGDHGWEQLKKVMEVRNRLVHPKNVAQLTVTEEELKQCLASVEWFQGVWRPGAIELPPAGVAKVTTDSSSTV